jgi:hypothetical protein
MASNPRGENQKEVVDTRVRVYKLRVIAGDPSVYGRSSIQHPHRRSLGSRSEESILADVSLGSRPAEAVYVPSCS